MNIPFENLELLKQIADDLTILKKHLLTTQSEKRWLSVKELSVYLSYSKDRIYKLKWDVFIQGVHFYNKNGKIIFDRVAIDDWVTNKETYETNQSQWQTVDNILSSIKEI